MLRMLGLIVLLAPLVARSQHYNFKHYTSRQGLGSSIVNCMFQDSRGFIWFGTQAGGISRFNGTEFVTYTEADSLIGNDVTCISEDLKGNIWVGTSKGASCFDGRRFTNYNEHKGLQYGKGVYAIHADKEGRIWFGLRLGGLVVLDSTGFTLYNDECGLPSNSVYGIAQDLQGHLWLACAKGIARYDGTQFTSFSEVAGRTFFSTMIDSKGRVWFGGYAGKGLWVYQGDSLSQVTLPIELQDASFGSMAEASNGDMWMATSHGALKFADGRFTHFTQEMGLPVNDLLSLIIDREGNIWTGAHGSGASVLSNEAFVTYTEKHGLSSNSITCIIAGDTKGELMVGTSRAGINRVVPRMARPATALQCDDKLRNANIFALARDTLGRVWAGAQEGLFILAQEADHLRTIAHITSIKGNKLKEINGVVCDPKGGHWISSYGQGLFRISGKDTFVYNATAGYPSDNILALHLDTRNQLWVTTSDKGVIRHRTDANRALTTVRELNNQWIWAVAEGPDNDLFLGTDQNGVMRYRQQGIKRYNTSHGIGSNKVKALRWDNHTNSLWAGTRVGMNRVTFGPTGSILSVRSYTERDGLPPIEFDQNAIMVADSGVVWFGSTSGLCRFNPALDNQNTIAPEVRLEHLLIHNEEISDWTSRSDSIDNFTRLPHSLQLSYRDNHLTFYTKVFTTDRVMYQFKMEGQDNDWSPWAEEGIMRYTNLEPGDYQLHVRAMNSNGLKSASPMTIDISIYPPFWATLWFRTGALGAFIGLLISFVKAREKVLRQQNLILERTVAERTAEVVHEKKEVEKQFQRSENLLLNILPKETAEELKATGESKSRRFDDVTIIFTDFKGFTQLAEVLTPIELVRDLHECFSEFDRICKRHRIEKIKTIGDAYMAAGGLPTPNETHAIDAVRAALEMRAFIEYGKALKTAQGLPSFEIRIGVHTGPVVAGIVGLNKFQYDIWGDTVNTASRMESSGEAGKVNISEATYQLVKNEFQCEYRGEIEAKGKGKMGMYFVGRA
jgi:ligand-binding sensor domain-containing protein/class 3 adenylate cyclase